MKKFDHQRFLYGILGCAILFAILFFPQQSVNGMIAGLLSCGKQVVPALFPFFVVSSLIIASPLADWLGIFLYPLTHFGFGISSRKAATALLISWLGGFAVAASTISSLYQTNEITRRQANLLLICGVGSGPAFVINIVGLLLLGNVSIGICLMASLLCANVATALLFRLMGSAFHPSEDAPHCAPLESPGGSTIQSIDLVAAIRNAVNSMLTVCGFVVFFRFLCTVLSATLPHSELGFFFVCAGLEVTTGCTVGSMLPGDWAVIACCAALSLQSLSVILQVRALLCNQLSVLPLLVARPVHLLFSLYFLARFMPHVPAQSAAAASTLYDTVISTTRTAPDTALVLFLLCCVVLHGLSLIQNRKRNGTD